MKNIKGLIVYSLSNMLERFGFYAMMSVIVLFLMEERGLSGPKAGTYYSMFYFAIYISMVIMGLIGDLVANRRKLIIAGMLIMAIGYVSYVLIATDNRISLVVPAVLLVIGVGAFKTNLMVQVGNLYKSSIKQGAIGYLIFFAFINVGALLAPLCSSYLRNQYGFDSVLLVSAGAVLLALGLYYLIPVTPVTAKEPYNERLEDKNNSGEVKPLSNKHKRIDKSRVIALVFLVLLLPVFYMGFHQSALVLTFYFRDFIIMNGYTVETLQSINPVASLLFSVIAILLLYYLIKLKSIYSIFPVVMAATLLAVIAYSIPAYGVATTAEKLPISYAILPMLIITLAEVFLSPFFVLGFYHLSPKRFRGLFFGIYMILTAIGNSLLFYLSGIYMESGAEIAFKNIIIILLISAAAMFLIWLLIKKLST